MSLVTYLHISPVLSLEEDRWSLLILILCLKKCSPEMSKVWGPHCWNTTCSNISTTPLITALVLTDSAWVQTHAYPLAWANQWQAEAEWKIPIHFKLYIHPSLAHISQFSSLKYSTLQSSVHFITIPSSVYNIVTWAHEIKILFQDQSISYSCKNNHHYYYVVVLEGKQSDTVKLKVYNLKKGNKKAHQCEESPTRGVTNY